MVLIVCSAQGWEIWLEFELLATGFYLFFIPTLVLLILFLNKKSLPTIKYFILLTLVLLLVLLELLRFIFVCCQPGLSVWKYDIYRTDKLLLEISLRISNRFSLLRKCKWSEYRALCRYKYIATYLGRLRAIKTMSKHFFIKDFYIVIVGSGSIVRYIYSMKFLRHWDLAWRQLGTKTPYRDLIKYWLTVLCNKSYIKLCLETHNL